MRLLAVPLAVIVVAAVLIVSATDPTPTTSDSLRPLEQEDPRPREHLPQFTDDGRLIKPADWQSWVMVGASVGLSYSEPVSFQPPAPDDSPGTFHNIYMQPWAYRSFRETGEFQEGTMFILAMYPPENDRIPARRGWYEGDGRLAEIHLKQEGLHETGWGFYGYGREDDSAELIDGSASCYSCHAEETVYDHVFVQFYPALRDKLKPAGSH